MREINILYRMFINIVRSQNIEINLLLLVLLYSRRACVRNI